MVIPPLAAKGAGRAVSGSLAASGLKNDIYVRKWTSVRGKGKDKRSVDHELHVNPVAVGVGLVGIGIGTAVAAWAAVKAFKSTGHRPVITDDGKTVTRIIDEFEAVYKDREVLVSEAVADERSVLMCEWRLYFEPGIYMAARHVYDDGEHHNEPPYPAPAGQLWKHFRDYTLLIAEGRPAVYETQRVLVRDGIYTLLSERGVPLGTYDSFDVAVRQITKRHPKAKLDTLQEVRTGTVRAKHPKTGKTVDCVRHWYQFKARGWAVEDSGKDSGILGKLFDPANLFG